MSWNLMRSQELKRCTKCGGEFPATGEWFRKCKILKCGLIGQCKRCTSKAWSRKLNKDDIERINLALNNKKKCSKCEKIFAKTSKYFRKKSSSKDRLSNMCKMCMSTKSIPLTINQINKINLSLQNKKQCTKCKSIQKLTFFPTRNNRLLPWCKACESKRMRIDYQKNKIKRNATTKAYYQKNKQRMNAINKKYRDKDINKIRKKEIDKIYYISHIEEIKNNQQKYNKINRKRITIQTKEYRNSKIKYNNPSFQQLIWFNKTNKNKDGYGEIACAYCGEWTLPTKKQTQEHVSAVNNIINHKMNRIYCSENCKEACPTYNAKLYPRGYKKASSREVNPLIRQMCFKYDDYECQKCGATQEDEQLHCHHIQGAAKEPLLANDIDNVITLCKTCHKWVHAQIDCGYADYRRPKCVEA